MECPQSRGQVGQRGGLRLIEEEWRCGGLQAAQAKGGGALVDADKAAADEGLQRGGCLLYTSRCV